MIVVVGVTVVVDALDPLVVGVTFEVAVDPPPDALVVVVGMTVVVTVGVTVVVDEPEPVGLVVVTVNVGVTVVVAPPDVLIDVTVTVLIGPGSTLTVNPSISMYVQPYKQYWKLTRLIGIRVGIVQL